jgi:hypothetical protein
MFETPFETDHLFAPSGQLIVGRYFKKGVQAYKVRRLDIADGNPHLSNEAIAVICMQGEKPTTSFDNRFVAFHHHSNGTPIQDDGTEAEAPNVFIYDLKTQKSVRVTNMKNGAKAYFPHFRADGWLYFLLKEPAGEGGDEENIVETVVASNIALVMKKQNP